MKIEDFPGELVKIKNKYEYSDEQKAWLFKYFPIVENHILLRVSGMTHSALHRFARKYGLTKSEKGMKAIKRRQAAHVKKVCEKNGYYASMRGRKPSEACKEGTKRMWAEIREGKRQHPFQVMKKKSRYLYKKFVEKMSVSRKELIRKEMLRTVYGLDRKTNLSMVVTCRFKRSQCAHRYNAKRRGYILPADISEQGIERYNIYYDDSTNRCKVFERNLIRDGFQLIPIMT